MPAVLEWLRFNWLLATVILVLAAAFGLLRTSPTAGIDTVEALDATLTAGQPVVLEFYSNFWSACLLAKPIVDGLETKLTGKAAVIRLDVMSRVGQQAARRYGVRGVPALVVVDGSGQAVFGQAGIPRPGQIIEQIETMIAAK